jgi:hypothetical protein
LPKLEPVGVLSDVDPIPVNVSISAFPTPPRKVTELLPLPAQPPHVNTPDVEKVIGVALASGAASNIEATNRASASSVVREVDALVIRDPPTVSMCG